MYRLFHFSVYWYRKGFDCNSAMHTGRYPTLNDAITACNQDLPPKSCGCISIWKHSRDPKHPAYFTYRTKVTYPDSAYDSWVIQKIYYPIIQNEFLTISGITNYVILLSCR